MNNILRTVARIAAGILFIFSGYVKAIDPSGSAIKFGEYFEAFGFHAFIPGALVFGIMLAVVELLIGLCFLFGLRMKQVSWLALLFMLFMTGLTFVLALTDKVKDCGCFGDAVKLTNWQTFYKNLVILPVIIYIFAVRKQYKPIMSCGAEWVTVTLLAAACTGISVYTYRHLPFIDFMPYKVGANILAGMETPEGAPQDEYAESTFIYEKDGAQKTFTMNDLPDSSWTFVDAPTPKLLKAGYTPPTRDFSISSLTVDSLYVYEKDGITQELEHPLDDTTWMFEGIKEETGHIQEKVLSQPGYLFFLTSPAVNKAARNKAAAINDIYDYSKANGMRFMFLSGSSEEYNAAYISEMKGKYRAYFTDETVIKSMVRSNPGLMLLKDGTILRKWNNRDFPSLEELNDLVKMKPDEIIEIHKGQEAASTWAFIAVVGFLFLFFSYKSLKRQNR